MAMYAPASEGKEFERPATGSTQGVCVDIRYLGRKRSVYDGRAKLSPKVLITFQIPQLVSEGNYAGERMVISEYATWSLFGSARLRGWLEGWLGRRLSDNECDSNHPDYFDFDSLIGRNGMLSLIEETRNNRVRTNISTIMPWDTKFGALMEPENYIRVADRPDYKEPVDDTLDGSAPEPSNGHHPPAALAPAASNGSAAAATKDQRDRVAKLAIQLWGVNARAECGKKYPAINDMTTSVAAKAIREIEELIEAKEAAAQQPTPAPAQPALVPVGADPFDDYDDADPFADQ